MAVTRANDNPSSIVQVEGEQVALPVQVRSATQVSATWMVDATAAQRLVDPSGLQVSRLGRTGRLTTCSIAAVAYADNDLGPYHEIAVAFAVGLHDAPSQRPPLTRPVTYIHRLPVNAEFTCAAGRTIWGFPKWVTTISIDRHRGRTRAVLVDDERFVLAFDAAPGLLPIPPRPLEMTSYSWLDGVLRRTTWTTTSHHAKLRPGGARLVLGDGHPMSEELRSLGLHTRRALFTMAVPAMTATFGAPEVISAT